MSDPVENELNNEYDLQCQYFVVRKKRLCRMTVRPGRQYCGEHEPQPRDHSGQKDTRVPCPLDPKHTCYASKLNKHLQICNARQREEPPYIVHNINTLAEVDSCVRRPLGEYSKEMVAQVIDKVNQLYDKYIKDNITTVPEYPIHKCVAQEYSEPHRAESSLRHLHQLSTLLHITEEEGLVRDRTCYVELGAGKGQLSYYLCAAWCSPESGSRGLLVDRSPLRHKRDNKPGCDATVRLRADLAHLALHRAPPVPQCDASVGLAKHLCGVATDYALRCMTARGMAARTRGLVLATCCHHRCERAAYVAGHLLEELGITGEDMNIMLGIVSWATCGDGLSRERRKQLDTPAADRSHDTSDSMHDTNYTTHNTHDTSNCITDTMSSTIDTSKVTTDTTSNTNETSKVTTDTTRNSNDTSKVTTDTTSNTNDTSKVKTDTTSNSNDTSKVTTDTTSNTNDTSKVTTDTTSNTNGTSKVTTETTSNTNDTSKVTTDTTSNTNDTSRFTVDTSKTVDLSHAKEGNRKRRNSMRSDDATSNTKETIDRDDESCELVRHDGDTSAAHGASDTLSREERAEVGRRAKAVLDWGRVLYLRACGLRAALRRYAPAHVSLENMCIVASKPS